MTDTTQAAAPAPAAQPNAIDTFFATLKSDIQVFEQDVISLCQNIGAGIEVAAEDISWGLSWLGGHIGQVSQTLTAVQSSLTAINAAGVAIPASLLNSVAQMNQAAAGVTAALNNQTLSADASKALTTGYQATKALQVAAASAAAIAASVQVTSTPATS